MRVTEYGLEWELSDDRRKGQLGLLRENHYRPLFAEGQRDLSFRPSDRWLDVGANLGAFAIRAASLVAEVIAVEPEPECFAQLTRNADLNGLLNKVYPLKAAMLPVHSNEWVELAVSKTFSSTHRLGKIRGRQTIEVAGIGINETLQSYDINKIKMDCEGSEEILLPALLKGEMAQIEELVFEWHFSFIKDRPWEKYFDILASLEEEGFTILRGTRTKSKTWHTIVWAVRR